MHPTHTVNDIAFSLLFLFSFLYFDYLSALSQWILSLSYIVSIFWSAFILVIITTWAFPTSSSLPSKRITCPRIMFISSYLFVVINLCLKTPSESHHAIICNQAICTALSFNLVREACHYLKFIYCYRFNLIASCWTMLL